MPVAFAVALLASSAVFGTASAAAAARRAAPTTGAGATAYVTNNGNNTVTPIATATHVRRDWRTTRTLAALGLDKTEVVRRSERDPPEGPADEGTVPVLGHWRYAGRSPSPGRGRFARTIPQDIADNRRVARLVATDQDLFDFRYR